MADWSGGQNTGSREYTPEDRARVVREIRERHTGQANRITSQDLARNVILDGRTLRAILSDIDGVEFVFAMEDDGLYACEYSEEAESTTRRLMSRARKMADRAERRQSFVEKHLERRQGVLIA